MSLNDADRCGCGEITDPEQARLAHQRWVRQRAREWRAYANRPEVRARARQLNAEANQERKER